MYVVDGWCIWKYKLLVMVFMEMYIRVIGLLTTNVYVFFTPFCVLGMSLFPPRDVCLNMDFKCIRSHEISRPQKCDLHPQTVVKSLRKMGPHRRFLREIGFSVGEIWNSMKFQFGARCMARFTAFRRWRTPAAPYWGGHLALAESDEEHDVQV